MKRALITAACLVALALLGLYIRQVIHETVLSRAPGQRYVVVLGDSVAAGAGLSDNGGKGSNGCDISELAFPYLLGKQLHEPVEQFACSGATVAGTGADNANTVLGTQYQTAVSVLPGSDIVVNAGANDIGWLQLLVSCTQTNCVTAQNRAATTGKLQTLQQNLVKLLGNIQQKHPHRLVINTYYSLLASGDTCVAHFDITPQEVDFINDEEARLNASITAAAAQSNATVVPVDFSGHTLCSADSWIQSISARAPLHPTATGQQQIAKQDAAVLTTISLP